MELWVKTNAFFRFVILAGSCFLIAGVLVLLWLLGGGAPPVLAQAGTGIIRVAITGTDTLGCGSGGVPCATVQYAVDQAQPGDEIRVAAGIYTGVQVRAGITQVVYISKTVTVRGGYTFTNWITSDLAANPTTLDAGGLGRVLIITGTSGAGRAITPTVEGLRITGGDAKGLGGCSQGDDAGGGVYVHTATATISGCIIYNNIASSADVGKGGGLYLEGSDATLQGNTVQSNTASTAHYGYGGGLLLLGSDAILQGNTIQTNTASTARSGVGGGLAFYSSDAIVEGNTVVSNIASTVDDGVGGGLYLKYFATLIGNTIISNTATLSPTAIGEGGGVWVQYGSSFTLTNNVVAGNHANTQGSGLGFRGKSDYPASGCLLHTTIADNGGSGQGVYVGATTTLILTNTIIAGHSVGITATAGSTVTLDHTLWYSNGTNTSGAGVITSAHAITDDPAFVAPAVWDYHLGSDSAAIDAGVNVGVATDIDGDPRPKLTGYDIGADEFALPFQVIQTSPSHTALHVPLTSTITTTFNLPVNMSTVSTRTFTVRGQQTGVYAGTYVSGSVQFDPVHAFKSGEEIVVNLNSEIRADDGTLLTPYAWQFRAVAVASSGVFTSNGQELGCLNSYAVELGDIDGDGDLDAFVGNSGSNRINRVWWNEGGLQGGMLGQFSDSAQCLGWSNTRDVALGDLDGDGDLDAFTANMTDDDWHPQPNRVWLNQQGVFVDSGQALGAMKSYAVALGDLDGDGDLDAFIGNVGANEVWLNQGGLQGGTPGYFTDSGQTLGDLQTIDVALGDLDSDGDLDAFAVNSETDFQPNTVWLNTGGIQGGTPGIFIESQSIGNAHSEGVVLGDLDGDGDLDAFVANSHSEANQILLNQGGSQGGVSGVFSETQSLGNENSHTVALGDLDGDGDLDAFVGNTGGNMMWINTGGAQGGTPGVFSDTLQVLADFDSWDVALGDLDNDGDLDVFVANVGWQVNEPNMVWLNRNQIELTPSPNSHNAITSTELAFSVNNTLSEDSVTTQTLVVHAGFHGRSTGIFSYYDAGGFGSAIFTPAQTFFSGELVETSVTTNVVVGGASLESPIVWQFRTAVTGGSGVFSDTGQRLGGDASLDVALGDVDGDGDLDAFVANTLYAASDLANRVWINTGYGTFEDSGQTLGDSRSYGVAMGDLDGDGDLDAFVANAESQANKVWLNDGGMQGGTPGIFVTTTQNLGDAYSYDVALGDVDGDGDLDAFIANYNYDPPNKVWVNDGGLQGGTPGNFSDSGQNLGVADSTGVALGDLDGDGDLDAFISNCCGDGNEVWLNDGGAQGGVTGMFSDSGQRLDTLSGRDVALGDLDGDGDLDAFLANDGANKVWLNDGDAGFVDSGQSLGAAESTGVALGDVDDDGDLDAYIANNTSYGAQSALWLNNGCGVFANSGQLLGSANSHGVALGDLDEDGDLDAFVTNYAYEANTIWLNRNKFQVSEVNPRNAAFDVPSEMPVTVSFDDSVDFNTVTTRTFTVWGSQTGSYTGTYTDGSVQFDPAHAFKLGEEIVANLSRDVWSMDGMSLTPYAWTFRTAVMGSSGIFTDNGQSLGSANSWAVALGDLDSDGDLDAFVANHNTAEKIYKNEGGASGHFDTGTALSPGYECTSDVALGDLDEDGDLDAFAVTGGCGDVNRVWLNNGSDFSDSGQALGDSVSWGVALGDLDGDGDLDAFVANWSGANKVWLNDGGAQEGSPGFFSDSGKRLGSSESVDVALGDLDGDGDLDAFVANIRNQPNKVWLNNGGAQKGVLGTFSDSGQNLGSGLSWAVALGDVDNDGDLDAWIANSDYNKVWLNDGCGNFSTGWQSTSYFYSFSVALGDVDGDGDLDAFVGTDNGQANGVWLNDGNGQFRDSGQSLGNLESFGVALGDIDGDGDLDAVVANNDGMNTVWLNQPMFPTSTILSGPTTGVVGVPYTFEVSVGPLTVTKPITYVWQATGQTPVTHTASVSTMDTVAFTWATTGTHAVTVTARNVAGVVTATHAVTLTATGLSEVNPAPNSHHAPTTTNLAATFYATVITPTFTSGTFSISSDFHGRIQGSFTFPVSGTATLPPREVVFDPTADFMPGELVQTTITTDVIVGGQPLSRPYVWQFRTAVSGGTGMYADSLQRLGNGQTLGVALGDLDADGDLDAFVANKAIDDTFNASNTVWFNEGGAQEGAPGTFIDSEQRLGHSDYEAVALGDLDGDGDLDAFVGKADEGGCEAWFNDGDGYFPISRTLVSHNNSVAVALGDVDGDGDLDAMVGNWYEGRNNLWLNQGGLQRGTPGSFISQTLETTSTRSIALGDVDGDGDLDAFMARWGPNQVWLNHNGIFTDSGQALGNVHSAWVALGDIDDDGDLDAVVANRANQPDKVWLNTGGVQMGTPGVFTDSGQALGETFSQMVALGDVDGDGDLDAVIANSDFDLQPNTLWLNDGGTFIDSRRALGSATLWAVALGDLDGDGDLDAFAGNGSMDPNRHNEVWLNDASMPWTVMIYLNGDNNLDAWTTRLFNRLEIAVADNPNLIIRVLWDRSNSSDTVLYQVQPDRHVFVLAPYVEGQTMWQQGELNMGDPGTLLSFITTTMQQFPAEYYFLAVVNHGGGWSPELYPSQRSLGRYSAGGSGLSWDITNGYSYLSTQDIEGVFNDEFLVSNPVDIVFYDACLMAMLEEVYAIHKGAHYLIASQNETWTSFPYDEYLREITSRRPVSQAAWIVNRHYASLSGYPRTMSALDLQYTSKVIAALNDLTLALTDTLHTEDEKSRIYDVFLASQKLDYDYNLVITDTEGYVDLGDFAARLIDQFPGTVIASSAEILLDVLTGYSTPFIIQERHGSGHAGLGGPYVNLDGVTGVSVYLPLAGETIDLDLPFYGDSQLSFAKNTYWNEFVFAFLNRPQPPTPDHGGGRGTKPNPILLPDKVFLPVIVKKLD